VDLNYREDGVRLTVTNPLKGDGTGATDGGADALHTLDGGYGLAGMRERLLLLRGSLEAGPRDGQWVVAAELPLPAGPLVPAAPTTRTGAPGNVGPSTTGSFAAAPVTEESDH
jgi:hypothetical protein